MAPSIQLVYLFTNLAGWHDAGHVQHQFQLERYSSSHKNEVLPADEYIIGLFSSGTSSSGYKGILLREKSFREETANLKFGSTISMGHPIVAVLDCSPAWGTGLDVGWKNICIGGECINCSCLRVLQGGIV